MAVAFYFPVCLFQLHFAYPKPLKAEKLGKKDLRVEAWHEMAAQ